MTTELKKRIITSCFLFLLLILMYLYTFVLIISLIIIAIICWIEFYALIAKIYPINNIKFKFIRFILKAISLIYLSVIVYYILIINALHVDYKIFILYTILVSIASDIGGLLIGKTFKGKKLSIISPNKTISGSIGSFIFSLLLIPFFKDEILQDNHIIMIVVTIIISLTSQIGDLMISFLKRKAKVKDTSDLLPGHGGFLDRVDGIILALPVGLLLFSVLT